MSEVQRNEERFWRRSNPVAYGVAISAIIILGYLLIGFRQQCIGTVCETNFQIFWESDPNEIGDTLAGLFSALAFVWIIVTVFLQSIELREQRKEFRQQREATQDMARAMAAQAEIFEDEKEMREHTRIRELLTQMVEGLADKLHLSAISFENWVVKHEIPFKKQDGSKVGSLPTTMEMGIFKEKDGRSTEQYIKASATHARLSLDAMSTSQSNIVKRPTRTTEVLSVLEQLQAILDIAHLASLDQKEYIKNLRIEETRNTLTQIMSFDSLWGKTQ